MADPSTWEVRQAVIDELEAIRTKVVDTIRNYGPIDSNIDGAYVAGLADARDTVTRRLDDLHQLQAKELLHGRE